MPEQDRPWVRPDAPWAHLGPTEPVPPVGTAVGRPVEPLTPMAAAMPVYSGSTQLPCAGCGRATWFGPRLLDKIDAGEARPSCWDCLYAYAVQHQAVESEVPSLLDRMVHLGNPEPKSIRIDTEWEIDVIRDGAAWIARGRCASINGCPVVESGWLELGAVAGATEDEAVAAARERLVTVKLRRVDGHVR